MKTQERYQNRIELIQGTLDMFDRAQDYDRLLALVTRWLASGRVGNLVCTIKFQGPTDHDVAARFAALPDA